MSEIIIPDLEMHLSITHLKFLAKHLLDYQRANTEEQITHLARGGNVWFSDSEEAKQKFQRIRVAEAEFRRRTRSKTGLLVDVVGLIGAGKTTAAKGLAQVWGALAHLGSNEYLTFTNADGITATFRRTGGFLGELPEDEDILPYVPELETNPWDSLRKKKEVIPPTLRDLYNPLTKLSRRAARRIQTGYLGLRDEQAELIKFIGQVSRHSTYFARDGSPHSDRHVFIPMFIDEGALASILLDSLNSMYEASLEPRQPDLVVFYDCSVDEAYEGILRRARPEEIQNGTVLRRDVLVAQEAKLNLLPTILDSRGVPYVRVQRPDYIHTPEVWCDILETVGSKLEEVIRATEETAEGGRNV